MAVYQLWEMNCPEQFNPSEQKTLRPTSVAVGLCTDARGRTVADVGSRIFAYWDGTASVARCLGREFDQLRGNARLAWHLPGSSRVV